MWLSGLDATFEHHHAHDTSTSLDIFAVFVGGMTPVRSFVPPKYGIRRLSLELGAQEPTKRGTKG